MWSGRLAGTQLQAAPKDKARKMRTGTHFAGVGTELERQRGVSDASGGLFSLNEPDLEGFDLTLEDEPEIGDSGLTSALLEMHDKAMEEEKEK